jgi:hypothetical protein
MESSLFKKEHDRVSDLGIMKVVFNLLLHFLLFFQYQDSFMNSLLVRYPFGTTLTHRKMVLALASMMNQFFLNVFLKKMFGRISSPNILNG